MYERRLQEKVANKHTCFGGFTTLLPSSLLHSPHRHPLSPAIFPSSKRLEAPPHFPHHFPSSLGPPNAQTSATHHTYASAACTRIYTSIQEASATPQAPRTSSGGWLGRSSRPNPNCAWRHGDPNSISSHRSRAQATGPPSSSPPASRSRIIRSPLSDLGSDTGTAPSLSPAPPVTPRAAPAASGGAERAVSPMRA